MLAVERKQERRNRGREEYKRDGKGREWEEERGGSYIR